MGVFVMHIRTKFHMPSSSGRFVISVKLKTC